MNAQELKVFKSLLRFAEINTCTHEETHRGGTIWTICDRCGCKWADDEDDKSHLGYPEPIVSAQALLDTHQPDNNCKIAEAIKCLKEKQAVLAKTRDELRDLQDEINDQVENADQANELLDEAIDRLSELV